MNLITITNLSHQYSERVLLEDANLLINEGDRIGLIGPNGSGKTTLLRLIAGLESPLGGEIRRWGGVTVRYLPQNPALDEDLTVLDYIFQSDAPDMRLLRRYEQLNAQLAANPADPELQTAFLEVSGEMDRGNGWAAEAVAKTVLTKLGITDFAATIGTLSGGQLRRVALANALLAKVDLLILDEPTNHIDADTVDWLEGFLRERPGALLLVTHDRYFLDRVVNRIVELDRRQLVAYSGNYAAYLEESERRQDLLASGEVKRQNLLRRELEWLRRGAMARSTKQKARKQRVEELQKIAYDRGDQRVAMALASRRLGKRVLEAINLSKSYDGLQLFENVDFSLNPGDRIGIIGPNGTGKSTFLDILANHTQPDSGQVEWGSTVTLGYYDQLSRNLDRDKLVLAAIEEVAPLIHTDAGERVEAAQMLEWFLFPRPQQRAYVSSLSGGEQRRLYLMRTLALQPNVLFLDEPTNDLDIQTLAVLEEFLDQFQGCLVVVSHDRYFLDRNVDFLVSFEDGVLGTRYPTPYASYRQVREEQLAQQAARNKPKAAPAPVQAAPPRTRKRTWREQKEYEALELEIINLEDRKGELEAA
ncbi:MAG: ABC-F family ATP-binding cassette domain-containing protein, partial [Anaerolineales bacterium]|nr:ABC-F family ATP-binding cassette domain-containing protein [Anaerolineales bacterium]